MKKPLACVWVFALLFCAFISFAHAEETPVPDALATETASAASAEDAGEATEQIVQLAVDVVSAEHDGETTVALSIANGNGVDSLECNLNYNAAAMTVTRVEPGDTFPAEYCITNTNEAGRVRLATACAFGLDNASGTVILLHCKLTGNAGSAITLSDVRATTVGAEYMQSRAYVGITDGGVTVGGGALPQSIVTPFIPETPVPPATFTPVPTDAPTPEIVETPVPAAADTPEPAPEQEKTSMLPYVLAGVIAILLAAGIVILLVSSSNKKKRKKKRKTAGKPRK